MQPTHTWATDTMQPTRNPGGDGFLRFFSWVSPPMALIRVSFASHGAVLLTGEQPPRDFLACLSARPSPGAFMDNHTRLCLSAQPCTAIQRQAPQSKIAHSLSCARPRDTPKLQHRSAAVPQHLTQHHSTTAPQHHSATAPQCCSTTAP